MNVAQSAQAMVGNAQNLILSEIAKKHDFKLSALTSNELVRLISFVELIEDPKQYDLNISEKLLWSAKFGLIADLNKLKETETSSIKSLDVILEA